LVLAFVAEHVGGKLLDRAARQGYIFVAGPEQERTTRRAFVEAAGNALREVCDESAAPVDEEANKALAEHLAAWLTEPPVAEMLFRAACVNAPPTCISWQSISSGRTSTPPASPLTWRPSSKPSCRS
jgi:hypothetical protein